MHHARNERLLSGPAHPLCIAFTALLALNDHVLKAAYANVWTGKISDICWVIVAPIVAAALLHWAGIAARVAQVIAVGSVAAFFTSLQLWPPLGQAMTGWYGGAHVADPTDLLALPAMLVVPLCWRRRRRYHRLMLGVSLIACVATSIDQTWDKRYPCNGEEAWDPSVPLYLHFSGSTGDLPVRSPAFQSAIQLRKRGGAIVETFIARTEYGDVAICPKGGLDPGAEYVWTVSPFGSDSANSLRAPTFDQRGTWSFVTDQVSDNKAIETMFGCRGVRPAVYDSLRCDSESGPYRADDTGDTGR